MVLFWILLATVINSLVAFIGVFSFFMKPKTLKKILFILVGFSAGALLSGGFFHLLAESLESFSTISAFSYVILGFVIFFLCERCLFWHHCHEEKCEVHPFTYMILFGDGVHNLIDGLVIAASFLVSIPFGIVTTLLIIGHEVPQELGDFGVLVYGGMSRKKALVANFASQTTCIIGGVIGFFFGNFAPMLLPFAAGGFFYIAASDLIPELHKEKEVSKSAITFAFFLVGILFMLGIKLLFGA